MAVEKFVTGSLVLVSDEAVKLYEMLAAEGNVMEYLSGLLESSAHGMMQAEMLGISSKLDTLPELIKRIDDLTKLVVSLSAAGGVVNNATPQVTSVLSQAVANSEINQSVEQIAVTKTTAEAELKPVAPTKVVKAAASMSDMMSRMAGMRNKNK